MMRWPAVKPHLHSGLVPLGNVHPLLGYPVGHGPPAAAPLPARVELASGKRHVGRTLAVGGAG